MKFGRLGGGGLLALVLLLWALVPLVLLARDVARFGGVLSGSDGALPGADQQLYLSWVRESGEHLLVSDRFRLDAGHALFLHPLNLVSGVLWRLGLGLKASLLVWKLPAAFVLGAGAWAYARSLLERGRAAAALLAVCFFSPILPFLVWGPGHLDQLDHFVFLLVSGETMPSWQLWGYTHTALIIGLMPLAVLASERALSGSGRSRYLATVAGLLIAWLHAWQGAELIAILVGVAAWGRFSRRYLPLVVPVVATALPLLYEVLLSAFDRDWHLNANQSRAGHAPAWILAAALAPLVLPALAGVQRPRTDRERMLVLWPAAAFALYFATKTFPYHALQGVSIPLAVLAVRAWLRFALPALAGAACVALLTLPGLAFQVDTLRKSVNSGAAPYRLQPGENDALHYLERAPGRGGVLAGAYLGGTIPALTGRRTWVGQFAWTPNFDGRAARVDALFAGTLPAADATAFVRTTGAAYVLADCRQPTDLRPLLGSLVVRVHHFRCATVYDLRSAA